MEEGLFGSAEVKPTEQVVVGVSLILEGESTVTDMVQIFQPFKVGDGYTASVQVHVLTEEKNKKIRT